MFFLFTLPGCGIILSSCYCFAVFCISFATLPCSGSLVSFVTFLLLHFCYPVYLYYFVSYPVLGCAFLLIMLFYCVVVVPLSCIYIFLSFVMLPPCGILIVLLDTLPFLYFFVVHCCCVVVL
jgi:hypothetical protein